MLCYYFKACSPTKWKYFYIFAFPSLPTMHPNFDPIFFSFQNQKLQQRSLRGCRLCEGEGMQSKKSYHRHSISNNKLQNIGPSRKGHSRVEWVGILILRWLFCKVYFWQGQLHASSFIAINIGVLCEIQVVQYLHILNKSEVKENINNQQAYNIVNYQGSKTMFNHAPNTCLDIFK